MANIVITAVATKTYHKMDYGVYSTDLGITSRFFWADEIDYVDLDGHVAVTMKNGEVWQFSWDGASNVMQIDSVLTVAPTSNSDLADKIANLKG